MPATIRTHCKRGHELSPDNIYIRKGANWTECKKCRRQKKLECRATRRITAAELRVLIRRLKNGGRLNQILKRYRAGKYDRELGVPGITTDSWALLRSERPALYAMVKNLANKNAPIFGKTNECRRGHPFVADNIYTMPDGRRLCRACIRIRNRKKSHNPNLPESVVRQVLFRLHEGANYENLAGRQQGKYSGGRVVQSTTKLRAFRLKHPKIGKIMDKLAEKNRVAAQNERVARRLVETKTNSKRDAAAYPIIMEATQKLPLEIREEIRSLMVLAVSERRLKPKDVPARVREFKALYRKQNKHSQFDEYDAHDSLDRQIFDDGPTTRGDTVTHGLWD